MTTTDRPHEPVALIDMDGTLCDFDKAMQDGLESLRSPGEDPTLADRENEDIPYMKARRRMLKRQPGFWSGLEPLALGFDILGEMLALKFRCLILTKGPNNPNEAWAEKVDWCKKYVPELPIMMVQDKGLVYGKVLADDWPPYVKRWLDWRPNGLVIVPAQRWNVDIETVHPNHTVRYDGKNMAAVRERLKAVRATAGE